jgi:hypothetical protein
MVGREFPPTGSGVPAAAPLIIPSQIGERLAKADPGNAGLQRDLSVSHGRIGELQQAQGDLAAALTVNRHITVGLAMLASAALGAAAVQTLHAQAKPPAALSLRSPLLFPSGR